MGPFWIALAIVVVGVISAVLFFCALADPRANAAYGFGVDPMPGPFPQLPSRPLHEGEDELSDGAGVSAHGGEHGRG